MLCGCFIFGGGEEIQVKIEKEIEKKPLEIRDRVHLEQFSGQVIVLEGKFDQIRGVHAMLKLKSGVNVYIPHFDRFAKGVDWFTQYVGKNVTVEGQLQTLIMFPIDNLPGPYLLLDKDKSSINVR